ncbi:MAG: hemin uptake protein HemP [Thiobacillus sp.]
MPVPPLDISPLSGGREPQTRPPGGIATARLFQGSREVLIDHNGETYRLRITKNDKLILTK